MTEPTPAELFTDWLGDLRGTTEPEPEAPEPTPTSPRPDHSQGSHGAPTETASPMQHLAHGLLDLPYADGRGNWQDLRDLI